MNARIQFPGGSLELPTATRAELIQSAADWVSIVEMDLAQVKADLERGIVYQLPIRALKSSVERLGVAMAEASK